MSQPLNSGAGQFTVHWPVLFIRVAQFLDFEGLFGRQLASIRGAIRGAHLDLILSGWRLRDGFNGAHVPQRSRSGGREPAGEKFERRAVWASCRQPDANACGCFNDTRSDLD